ncbi:hypothetical protein AXF42_Ash009212 [Apostasia shenzhenica]|uniref:Glycosyltransferase 61 catalytic domain-containing protein n=1 Tax=Apostasia shenzhenica TaxID=1088818 RepID=A0A2I0ADY6_9ASPA|nr:hypothetical protein AXF42_Ash009212 [Apostasia shenzhenica]
MAAKNNRFFFRHLRKWVAESHPVAASSDHSGHRKNRPTLLRLLFLLSLALSFLVLYSSSILCPFFSPSRAEEARQRKTMANPCSSVPNNSICCDRAAFRTDVCFLRGDVRSHSPSSSLFLASAIAGEQSIRPYPRKWETSVMSMVAELRLHAGGVYPNPTCDVVYSAPAVVFSTGGYTGNVFHDFNDGIIPLYLTAHHYNREVVFLILDYHKWWFSKYSELLSRLSRFPPINFSNDSRTHCFTSATVGLRIHDDLAIDPAQSPLNNSIRGFRQLLDDAYGPRIRWLDRLEAQSPAPPIHLGEANKPRLAMLLRNGSRALENEGDVVTMAEEMGFVVEVLRPEKTTELMSIYRILNGSEVMLGVHGAAMTHFLFMRPGAVILQIVPIGTEWAAETFYGSPARKMGMRYVRYRISPEESSLCREYGRDHPVVREPKRINARGWEETKRIYLDWQSVRLDLRRFRRTMERVRRVLDGSRRRRRRPEEDKEEDDQM